MTSEPRTQAWSVLGSGLASALAIAGIALQPLTLLTVQLLLIRPENDPQPPISVEGFPVPRPLLWSPSLLHFIDQFGRMPSAAVLGYEIALVLVICYVVIRAINPSFRLTTGVDWDSTVLTRTYMHSRPLIKAFLIAVSAIVPCAFLWYLLSLLLGDSRWAFMARTAAMGSVVWFLFSRDGVAGQFDSLNYDLPRNRRVVGSLLARGAAIGLLAGAGWAFAPLQNATDLFLFHRSLGGIGQGTWLSIAAMVVGTAAALGFAGGGLVVALGRPALSVARRVLCACLPATLLGLVMVWGHWVVPNRMRSVHDFLPERNVSQGQRLARIIGSDPPGPEALSVLVLSPDRSVAIPVRQRSITGLALRPGVAESIEAYLRGKRYASALNDAAYKTLFDGACYRWDSDETLRVCMLNLEKSPEPVYQSLVVEKLSTCAGTGAARGYLDRLSDPQRFAFPDRRSRTLMGDLYARFGEKKRAAEWYRKAGISPMRLEERVEERALFSEGVVRGRILLDGKPAAGIRVGVVPEPALRELPGMFLEDGSLRPFWLRWVAARASTDEAGGFKLEKLLSGTYRLVVGIPGQDVRLRTYRVQGGGAGLASLQLDLTHKSANLGDINLVPVDTPQPMPSRPERKAIAL